MSSEFRVRSSELGFLQRKNRVVQDIEIRKIVAFQFCRNHIVIIICGTGYLLETRGIWEYLHALPATHYPLPTPYFFCAITA